MSKRSWDQDTDMFGTEYTVTPARFIMALTWIIALMFVVLAAVISPVIYITEGDLIGAIAFLLLIAGIGIPVFAVSWYYSPEKYTTSERGITIIRPVGDIVIPIEEITKVEPKDYRSWKLLRTWGNGGLFSISGKFWNKTDGSFWCYGKNNNFVMIHAKSKWVVTPDDMNLFITDVKGKMDKVKGRLDKGTRRSK